MFPRPIHRCSLAWLLFALFALMQVNLVVFRHGHRLADGRIISHAHPFWPNGKGPIHSNSHSPSELALLDAVSNGSFILDMPEVIDFQVLVPVSFARHFFFQPPTVTQPFFCFSHRGPPHSFVADRLA